MEAVIFALLLGLAQPDPPPCAALERCEIARRENLDMAIEWKGRAKESREFNRESIKQLLVRTSTPTPAVVRFEAIESGVSTGAFIGWMVAAASAGALVATVLFFTFDEDPLPVGH